MARWLRVWQHLVHSAHQRQKDRRTVLEGIHLLQVYQATGKLPLCWFVDGQRVGHAEIQALMAFPGWPEPWILESSEFERCSGLQSPVGVAALIDWPASSGKVLPSNGGCLVLDRLQDPGNVGTLIRSAVAAGLRQVVLGQGSVQGWSPKVLRAAMGAHFHVVLHENVRLPSWLDAYQGRIVGALREAARPYDTVDMTGNVALVVGHEGSGLSQDIVERLHERVFIPMEPSVESLNAAVAGSVLLFERQRQQRGQTSGDLA